MMIKTRSTHVMPMLLHNCQRVPAPFSVRPMVSGPFPRCLFDAHRHLRLFQRLPLSTYLSRFVLFSNGPESGLPPATRCPLPGDRKSTRLNSSHRCISYAVFCLKKKKNTTS